MHKKKLSLTDMILSVRLGNTERCHACCKHLQPLLQRNASTTDNSLNTISQFALQTSQFSAQSDVKMVFRVCNLINKDFKICMF